VLEKPPLSKDTLQDNSKRSILRLKVLKSALLPSIQIMAQSSSLYGIPLVNKNSEDSEKDIILEQMLLFLCLMSQQELPTKMFPNGTKI
jgi:hypothetical protein